MSDDEDEENGGGRSEGRSLAASTKTGVSITASGMDDDAMDDATMLTSSRAAAAATAYAEDRVLKDFTAGADRLEEEWREMRAVAKGGIKRAAGGVGKDAREAMQLLSRQEEVEALLSAKAKEEPRP